jgi:predicted RecB family nuclease
LGTEGTVLVYNKTFEATRLKELAREYPQYKEAVDNILGRMVDLMAPFRKHYRLPEMQGSYSIKQVLPALIPELKYDDLTIGNGGDASAAFFNLCDETDAEKIKATREALLEYCGLDTLAMVRILEKLNERKS